MTDIDLEPGENRFEFPSADTTLEFYGEGLGDKMIIRQFGQAFEEYVRRHTDPELGDVVIAFGAMDPAFTPLEGDLNLYWWTSFGRRDDRPETYLDHYLDEVTVEPDIIVCLSDRQEREARQAGYDTFQLQFAQYGFEPLDTPRSGLGYAGSIWHKRDETVKMLLGPFRERADFENVTTLSMPSQLNLWYNSKLATFGLFKQGQRDWGIVNNRVYETLASGTPLITEPHPDLEDVLGIEYPFQASSQSDAVDLVDQIQDDPQSALTQFREFSKHVRENHTYVHRIRTLVKEVQ